MPRALGQVDEAKTDAILEAASDLFAEKGVGASMEAIARRAGVSRQTLYNRYPSKLEIGRALAARRSSTLIAPLKAGGELEPTLFALAKGLLDRLTRIEARRSMRGVAMISPQAPDVAQAMYDAGPGDSLHRLAAWLSEQDRAGRLSVPNPEIAAEMFAGMVLGYGHLRAVLGVGQPAFDRDARAQEAVARFLRAFAP